MSDLKLHRWKQQDGEWACAVYDHGPMCRLCQPVDSTLRTFLDMIDTGETELVGVDRNGEMQFRLTEAGTKRAREVIERMSGDPDDGDSILAALRRDIAGSN